MIKSSENLLIGGQLRHKGVDPVGPKASNPPPGFEQFRSGSHVYLFCQSKVTSASGQQYRCDFAIRKDRIAQNEKLLEHACKCVQLESFVVTTQVQPLTPMESIHVQLAIFVGSSGISIREAGGNSMGNLIATCIEYGRTLTMNSQQSAFRMPNERQIRKQMIIAADQEFHTMMDGFKKVRNNCLVIDAGKINKTSYLLGFIVNPFDNMIPLCVLMEPHFNGTTNDYSGSLLKLLEKLCTMKLFLGSIVSDSLRAQVNSVSHLSKQCFHVNHPNLALRGIIWIPCSCHLLHLCIKDLSKEIPLIEESILSINETRIYFNRKPILPIF